jgi:hypothetical protein
MVAPHGILCEVLICRLEEVGGHLQVALRRSNIDVAKVGGELRKQELDVLTCPIPCHHPMHGRGVAKIMQARGPRFASRANYACGSANILKPRDDASVVPCSSIARGEKRRHLPAQ